MSELHKVLLPPVCGLLAFIFGFVLLGLWGGLGFGLLGLLSGLTKVKHAT